MEKCKHPSMALVSVGSSSEPNRKNNYRMYHCLLCDILLKVYYNDGHRLEEMPRGVGLISAILVI